MIDYGTGVNLASDIIIPGKLRVSTASFSSSHYWGSRPDAQIETWIFSDLEGQGCRQTFHKTREEAVRAHKHIVENLRKLYPNENIRPPEILDRHREEVETPSGPPVPAE